MRFIKATIRFIMGLGVAAVAGALFYWPLGTAYDHLIRTVIPEMKQWELLPSDDVTRMSIAGIVLLLALWSVLPSLRFGGRRTISFSGVHGEVVIELDSLEKGLIRALKAMPEIKQVNELHVKPVDSGRRIRVTGDVIIKQMGITGAREAANRVSEFIAGSANGILGMDNMVMVDLNVSGILVDPKAIADALMRPVSEQRLLPEHSTVPEKKHQQFQTQQQTSERRPETGSESLESLREAPVGNDGSQGSSTEDYVDPSDVEPVDDNGHETPAEKESRGY